MKEAKITIGGIPLTVGQSMTLRVALSGLAMEPSTAFYCGDDAYGKMMKLMYQERNAEILALIRKAIENDAS